MHSCPSSYGSFSSTNLLQHRKFATRGLAYAAKMHTSCKKKILQESWRRYRTCLWSSADSPHQALHVPKFSQIPPFRHLALCLHKPRRRELKGPSSPRFKIRRPVHHRRRRRQCRLAVTLFHLSPLPMCLLYHPPFHWVKLAAEASGADAVAAEAEVAARAISAAASLFPAKVPSHACCPLIKFCSMLSHIKFPDHAPFRYLQSPAHPRKLIFYPHSSVHPFYV